MIMLLNRSMPNAFVISELSEAIDWRCGAYGCTLRLRIGNHRAQLRVGSGAIVLTERHEALSNVGDPPLAVKVRVEDVNCHYQHAAKRGADIVRDLGRLS
jgi:uncharacterized glyoxalase superfamily protein PhnB